VRVGIVGDMTDSYLEPALEAAKRIDTTRFTVDIITVDADEAPKLLNSGELVAYVVLPDNFVKRALEGDIGQVTCVSSSGASGFGNKITNELLRAVAEVLLYGQKTVYGFQDAASAVGIKRSIYGPAGTDLAYKVLDIMLAREKMSETREIGGAGQEDLDDPMVSGLAVLFLLLWGITCCTVCAVRRLQLSRVLHSQGTGAFAQILCEYGAYFIFMTVTVGILASFTAVLIERIPQNNLFEPIVFMRALPGFFLAVLAISAMQFFLYEAANGIVASVLLQFVCALGMGYVTGCLYPAYFFPREVQRAASFLPSWAARIHIDEWLSGRVTAGNTLLLVGYFILFFALSVIIRRARIRSRGGAL